MTECESIPTTLTTKTHMVCRCLRELVTGRDNTTHDLGRWSWALCVAAVLAHDAWQLYLHVPVNVKDLAIALAAVVVAHGAALGLKADTEPAVKP